MGGERGKEEGGGKAEWFGRNGRGAGRSFTRVLW